MSTSRGPRRRFAFLIASAISVLGLLALPVSSAAAAHSITITSPGTQNSYEGDPVYLQIHAKDVGSGTTLSYAVSQLPDGLTLNHRTGVISGRPTLPADVGGDGTDATITVSDSDGATATTSLNWNVTNNFWDLPVGPVRSAYAGMCLNDTGGRTTTGNPLQLWPCDNEAAQNAMWNSSANDIQIMGKCVGDGSGNPGTVLRLASCDDNGAQILAPTGNGGFMFFNDEIGGSCLSASRDKAGTSLTAGACVLGGSLATGMRWALPTAPVVLGLNGKCLVDPNPDTYNPVKTALSTCGQQSSLNWSLWPMGITKAGLLVYQVVMTQVPICLTPIGGGTANATKADWQGCDESETTAVSLGQRWVYSNGALVNERSGRCLDDPSASTVNAVQLDVRLCTGQPDQRWSLPPSPIAAELPGSCLSGTGTDAPNGSVVVTSRCASAQAPTAAQEWTFTGGTLRSQGRCLSVRGTATGTGTAVQVLNCTTGAGQQQWRELPGGLLRNPRSGKCLAFPGAAAADGVGLVIKPCSATEAAMDEWHIV